MPKIRLRSGVPDRRPQACEGEKLSAGGRNPSSPLFGVVLSMKIFLYGGAECIDAELAPTLYSGIFLYGGAERSDAELAPTLYLGIFVRMRRTQ